MGTVPIGTGEASMMARRMASMSRPVERSMTVSAPKWTAVCSFSSSPGASLVTAELPMLALILVFEAMPMHIGSSRLVRCTLLAGMTIRPRATSSRISSTGRFSRFATYSISGVIWPPRAISIWVMCNVYASVKKRGSNGGLPENGPRTICGPLTNACHRIGQGVNVKWGKSYSPARA